MSYLSWLFYAAGAFIVYKDPTKLELAASLVAGGIVLESLETLHQLANAADTANRISMAALQAGAVKAPCGCKDKKPAPTPEPAKEA